MAVTKAPKALHIKEIMIENIKKIKYLRIKPQDGRYVIEFAGENGQGKSSAIDAFLMAMLGAKYIPSQPIKTGQKQAQVDIDFGEYKLTRYFYPDGKHKLIVKDKDGRQEPAAQNMLLSLLSKFSLDPVQFLQMEKREQLEELRKVSGLDLKDFDTETAVLKAKRTEEGRTVDDLRGRVAAMPNPPNVPDKPIDTQKLVEKMTGASAHNSAIDGKVRDVQGKRISAETRDKAAEQIQERIANLKAEIQDLTEAAKAATADAKKLRSEAEKMEKAIPEKMDLAALGAQINEANAINQQIQQAKARKALVAEYDTAKSRLDMLEITIKDRSNEREQKIREAHMPVPGLGFGDNEVIYNGLPFEQASNAEQIRVAMAMAMALNPTIRVLCIKDGALLDSKSRAIVDEMAAEYKYQTLIECIAPSNEHSIIFEDGAATGEDVVK